MHEHDLPSAPGALLGYRRDGRPVRLIAGASEPAPEPAPAADPAGAQPGGQNPPASPAPAGQGTPPAAQPGQPAPAGPPPGQPAGTAPAEPSGQQGDPAPPAAGSVDDLPPWAQRLIRDTRNEAATHRTRAKEREDQLTQLQQQSQQQLDAIAKALGLKPEEATPEQIMAERDAANAERDRERARARATAVELAVFRAAAEEGANGDALLDSRSFVARLDGLDPADSGFAQQVKDLIRAAAEEDDRYRSAPPLAPPEPPAAAAPPAVPKSGGEFTGPPAAPRQLDENDAKNMTPSQVADAMDKGLFAAAGYGPRRASRR